MIAVAIVPESGATGTTYRAVSGGRQSVGKTAGEALDAITALLDADEGGTLIIVQKFQPDRFFTQAQISRLQELMRRQRAASEQGAVELTQEERTELNDLIDAELLGSARRTEALANALGR